MQLLNRLIYLSAAVSSVVALTTDTPPADIREPGLVQPAYTHYMGREWRGRIDNDGTFVPDVARLPTHPSAIGFPFVVNGFCGKQPIYEHRTGRLIRGVPVSVRRDGKRIEAFSVPSDYVAFVPEVGSRVLDALKDVDVNDLRYRIYNMRERPPGWPPAGKRSPPGTFPPEPSEQHSDPPLGGVPAGFELALYRTDKTLPSRKVIRVVSNVMWVGELADDGEFLPDPELPAFPRPNDIPRTLSFSWNTPAAVHTRMYYTLPIGGGAEGQPVTAKSEPVYEYRSGRIIKGVLHDTGTFVPEVGSKVLDFKDYPVNEAGPPGLRVYNLPGVLRKITKPAPPK